MPGEWQTSPERLGDEVVHWNLGSHLRHASEDGARHLHLLRGTPRHGPSEKAELEFRFMCEGGRAAAPDLAGSVTRGVAAAVEVELRCRCRGTGEEPCLPRPVERGVGGGLGTAEWTPVAAGSTGKPSSPGERGAEAEALAVRRSCSRLR
jgi:hypothetical protein